MRAAGTGSLSAGGVAGSSEVSAALDQVRDVIALGLRARLAEAAARDAERARMTGEARLRLLVEHAPAAIAMRDRSMRYVAVSRRFAIDYRLGDRPLLGQSHYDVFPELPAHIREVHARCLAGAIEGHAGEAFRRDDGSVDWVRWAVHPWTDATGAIGGVLLFSEVLTERERMANALDDSEARFRTVFEQAGTGLAVVDAATGQFLEANDRFCASLGHAPTTLRGLTWHDVIPPDDHPVDRARREPYHASHAPTRAREIRHRRADGQTFWGRLTFTRLDEPHRPARLLAVLEDLTASWTARQALRVSEHRLATLFELAPIGIAEGDLRTHRLTHVNSELCAITGYSTAELCAMPVLEHLPHPDDRPAVAAYVEGLAGGTGVARRTEGRWVRKDGRTICVRLTVTVVEDDAGQRTRALVTAEDISEHRSAQSALHVYTGALLAAANAIVITDLAGTILAGNPALELHSGYPLAELIGANTRIFRSGVHPPTFYEELWRTVLAGQVWRGELINRRKDGSHFTEEMTITPVRDGRGEVAHLVAIKQDVTARDAAERALRASEGRYRTLVDNLEDVVFTLDPELTLTFVNRAVATFGYAPDALIGLPALALVVPDDHAAALAMVSAATDLPPRELRVLDAAGRVHPVRAVIRTTRDGDRVTGVTGVLVDLTARRDTEEQLRAAQKMEAIGRLAGGVAHDFNNLLSVILSYTDLAIADLAEGSPLRADLVEVQAAAKRAAGLTRQLLAFGRKQLLNPEATDLRELVAGLAKMLRRLIGEDIDLVLAAGGAAETTVVDRGQMEQVIMNLVVNARDAMPDGGTVSIATADVQLDASAARALEVPPGRYVRLTVSDTGCGMTDAVRAHIFEPFYTTKAVGKGTGLGLAMVYGMVRQSGGGIAVESAPGGGTTFHIYLVADAQAPRRTATRPPTLGARVGRETVLVVEDELALRGAVERALANAGYEVLSAADAVEAVQVAQLHGPRIHVILTDVIMPGMNGRQLVERLAPRCPQATVIFMSGYTDEVLAPFDVLDSQLLRKPFDLRELTARIRAALDARVP